jgi:hypothetical protein
MKTITFLACLLLSLSVFSADNSPAKPLKKNPPIKVEVKNFLSASTPEDVLNFFQPYMSQQLDNCFALYKKKFSPSADRITLKVVEEFLGLANYPYHGEPLEKFCHEWSDLKSIAEEIFRPGSPQDLSLEEFKNSMKTWALQELKKGILDGRVVATDQWKWIYFYAHINQANIKNALARANNPSGTTYKKIMDAWDEVLSNTNLDNDFLLPVIVDPKVLNSSAIFSYIRAYFSIRGKYVSAGRKAVADFAQSREGPDSETFNKVLAPLLNTPAFKKWFFFQGAGENWSRNYLLVVDNQNQMFGLEIGYSE